MPAVSVVIPLYNKGPYIARSLNSVLIQTFSDFEVIVVDDGSTDGGAEIVRGFTDPRIKLIQQENQGVSAARNRGIEAASAEMVAFLDADDEWLQQFLEIVTKLRGRFPGAGAYATAVTASCKGTMKRFQYRSIPSSNWEGLITDYFRALAFGDSILFSSSVAIPREILREMNGFTADTTWGEDLDLWGRIALKYPIGFSTSHCSIIHMVNESLDQIYGRVTVTRENPFLKSAAAAIKGEKSSFFDRRYLTLYFDRMVIESALFNAIIGRKNDSKEILNKCKSKAFFLTKTCLILWYAVPEQFVGKNNKVWESSLLMLLLYLLPLEVRIFRFAMRYLS